MSIIPFNAPKSGGRYFSSGFHFDSQWIFNPQRGGFKKKLKFFLQFLSIPFPKIWKKFEDVRTRTYIGTIFLAVQAFLSKAGLKWIYTHNF